MSKKKMGRPPLPERKTRKPGISVRLDDDEIKEIEAAIARGKTGKSEWIRDALLAKARGGRR